MFKNKNRKINSDITDTFIGDGTVFEEGKSVPQQAFVSRGS